MASWVGTFDSEGCPTINITVGGLTREPFVCEALIDTGFTGFLFVPISKVHVAALHFGELQRLKLADGIARLLLTTRVTVFVGAESIVDECVLDPDGSEVIVGMEFLRRFGRGLTIFPRRGSVHLPEE